jgi:hypothetical protein
MRKVCDKCRTIKDIVKDKYDGKYYGAGCWMCDDCYKKLNEEKK